MRILHVDDSEIDLAVMRQALEGTDWHGEIVPALRGHVALDGLRTGDQVPDLILLDLTMPGMKGLELLGSIRRDDRLRRIPVIVFSGSTDPNDVQECYALGCSAFLTKPYNMEDAQRVANFIREFTQLARRPS